MDIERIRELAESAIVRANACHFKYQETGITNHLNDAFYWWGHANAYKGVITGLELMTVVEDERDTESSCP